MTNSFLEQINSLFVFRNSHKYPQIFFFKKIGLYNHFLKLKALHGRFTKSQGVFVLSSCKLKIVCIAKQRAG